MISTYVASLALLFLAAASVTEAQVTKFVRYSSNGATLYGILDGETIRELSGDLFRSPTPTGKTVRLASVMLLAPVVPSKVIAVGLNYRSHLGETPPAKYPGLARSRRGASRRPSCRATTCNRHSSSPASTSPGRRASPRRARRTRSAPRFTHRRRRS